jgi:hypothetical protein
MRRVLAILIAASLGLLAVGDAALAKKRKRFWNRYDATILCDIASSRVVVYNPAKVDLPLLVRLADASGDTQQILNLPAEGVTSFDCTSLGVSTQAVLSFEGPVSLHATVAYQSPGGDVDVETISPERMRGRSYPGDDSDTGDSDSASGDPTPMP